MFHIAEKDLDRCKKYGICDEIVACSSASVGNIEECARCEREMISLFNLHLPNSRLDNNYCY